MTKAMLKQAILDSLPLGMGGPNTEALVESLVDELEEGLFALKRQYIPNIPIPGGSLIDGDKLEVEDLPPIKVVEYEDTHIKLHKNFLPSEKRCSCPMNELMAYGCKCGGK